MKTNMTALTNADNACTCVIDSLDAFNSVDLDRHSLVLWERGAVPTIERELAGLPDDVFPDVRAHLHADNITSTLTTLVGKSGYDAVRAFPGWLADMTMLTETFFQLVGDRCVTARLETLARTGCPRFHVDRSHLRLVCTYRGTGTEYLEEAQVDRVAQASGAPNESIIRFGEPQRLPTFAVGIMKGSRYPGYANAGLVHRSPAVNPGDPARVLFCLDC